MGTVFPDGFLYAIGFAGLAATIWAVIVPALLARKSRKRFDAIPYQVWGGYKTIYLVLRFGVINIFAFLLSNLQLLPVFK